MPRLSDSMEEGTIIRWLKASGDEIQRGDELVEIETDKANMTYEADGSGFLELIAREGDTLPVGAVIAQLQTDRTEISGSRPAPRDTPPSEPAPLRAAEPNGSVALASGPRIKASPLARRIARGRGIELAGISGSGPGGRIVRADVEGSVASSASPPQIAAEPDVGKGAIVHEELTSAQQVIARRMAESKATTPEFTLSCEIDMDACLELRGQIKAATSGARVPSINDMVVKACGLALREFPRANGSYRDGHFELHSRVNVGIAVAAGGALVVPTVFDADHRTLGEIAQMTGVLAARVRSSEITPPELSGGTFTVSNLGMYGVSSFTAIINTPQAAILAIGSVSPRAGISDGAVVSRQTMCATLVCDHRILYGAEAAQFLARVRAVLEAPVSLLV